MASYPKIYELTNGTTGTAQAFSEQSGLPLGTIYTRLKKTRDPEKLFRSVAKARKDTGWHKVNGRLFFGNRNEQVPYE